MLLEYGGVVKKGIHPDYILGTISCACGNIFQTGTTVGDLKLDICSNCHPFFTGKQKLVDTAGRVEKYYRKFRKSEKSIAADEAKESSVAADEAKES